MINSNASLWNSGLPSCCRPFEQFLCSAGMLSGYSWNSKNLISLWISSSKIPNLRWRSQSTCHAFEQMIFVLILVFIYLHGTRRTYFFAGNSVIHQWPISLMVPLPGPIHCALGHLLGQSPRFFASRVSVSGCARQELAFFSIWGLIRLEVASGPFFALCYPFR